MAKKSRAKRVKTESNKSLEQNNPKFLAFVATFLSIIGFLIALAIKRDDKYVLFYAKQSLVVFIALVIGSIINSIVWIIPIIGTSIKFVLSLLVFILWLFSWVYALSGEMREVPLIGGYGEKINL